MARSATSSKQLRLLADDDLMRLVADGEVGAFEVLFERHAGAAFSLAYRICLQRPMAEDIAQEAAHRGDHGSTHHD